MLILKLKVKLSLCQTKYHAHSYLTSVLDGDSSSVSWPVHFTAGIRDPTNRWIRGWVGPSVGLDAMAKWKSATISFAGNWSLVVRPVITLRRRKSDPSLVRVCLQSPHSKLVFCQSSTDFIPSRTWNCQCFQI